MRVDALRKYNSTSLMDHLRLPNSIWEKERAGYRSASVTSLHRDGLAWHVKCSPNSVPDSRTTVLFHCTSVTHTAPIHCYPGCTLDLKAWAVHLTLEFIDTKVFKLFQAAIIREIDFTACIKRLPWKVILQHLCSIKFYQPQPYNNSIQYNAFSDTNTAILSRAYSKHTL